MRSLPAHCPECGCVLKQSRSPQQHKFFFAAVKAAFMHWPHDYRFVPDSEEHLRAWLLVEAKHCTIIGQTLRGDPGDALRMAAFVNLSVAKAKEANGFMFIEVIDRKSITGRFPRSVSWREVDQKAFQPIAQAVFEIIHDVIGTPVEQLVAEHEAAA
jgi:hypothetical protein